MDRENFPGMPSPDWTYGALSLYVETPPSVRAAAVGRVFEIREFPLGAFRP